MSRVYTTVQGEMLDAICRKIYGDESGYVEELLSLNPNLADASYILPLGTRVALPDFNRAEAVKTVVSFWS